MPGLVNATSPQSPQPGDPLEAFLLEAQEHIPDEGFTARVIASLPPRRRPGLRRAGILASATLVGAALAVGQLPPPSLVSEMLAWGWRAAGPHLIPLLLPVLLAVVALGWSVYALVSEEA